MEGSATGVTTEELLQQILETQKAHRDEVAELRAEIAAAKPRTSLTAPAATPLDPQEALAQRLAEVAQHSHYCPACGKLVDYQQQCVGRDEAPHAPTEVVPTSELTEGDSEHHTPAPYVTGEGTVIHPTLVVG